MNLREVLSLELEGRVKLPEDLQVEFKNDAILFGHLFAEGSERWLSFDLKDYKTNPEYRRLINKQVARSIHLTEASIIAENLTK